MGEGPRARWSVQAVAARRRGQLEGVRRGAGTREEIIRDPNVAVPLWGDLDSDGPRSSLAAGDPAVDDAGPAVKAPLKLEARRHGVGFLGVDRLRL